MTETFVHPIEQAWDQQEITEALAFLTHRAVGSEDMHAVGRMITAAADVGASLADIAFRLDMEPHVVVGFHVESCTPKRNARDTRPKPISWRMLKELQEWTPNG